MSLVALKKTGPGAADNVVSALEDTVA
jgi:hypothetical protein